MTVHPWAKVPPAAAPPDPAYIDAAVGAANGSPCAKSKRGVAIFKSPALRGAYPGQAPVIFTTAHNGPPAGLPCLRTDVCRVGCGRYCVHAETRALLRLNPTGIADACEMLHVKTIGGALTGGAPPSCLPCAALVREVNLVAFWLYVDPEVLVPVLPTGTPEPPRPGVWHRYTAAEFFETTLENCALGELIVRART